MGCLDSQGSESEACLEATSQATEVGGSGAESPKVPALRTTRYTPHCELCGVWVSGCAGPPQGISGKGREVGTGGHRKFSEAETWPY